MPDFTQLTADDRAHMLRTIGVERVEQLFDGRAGRCALSRPRPAAGADRARSEPPPGRAGRPERLGARLAVLHRRRRLQPLLAVGGRPHHGPAAASTRPTRPYQPEVSQGTLQASFEFQSLVCELLGLDVANDSVYDGASAVGEAVLMAQRLTRRERVVLAGSVHPQWREVVADVRRAARRRHRHQHASS